MDTWDILRLGTSILAGVILLVLFVVFFIQDREPKWIVRVPTGNGSVTRATSVETKAYKIARQLRPATVFLDVDGKWIKIAEFL